MTDKLWGVWGGRYPGAWCSFRCAGGALSIGTASYGYAGTREEAIAGKAVFNSENDFDYEVTPFDPSRDPVDQDDVPSPAQVKALRIIDAEGLEGLIVRRVKNWSATDDAIYRRGWSTTLLDAEGRYVKPGARLTKAGRAALQRAEAKDSRS